MDDLTVFIIDDDMAICQSMRWLFESVSIPVKIYNTANDFLKSYSPNWQGCIITDVRMPLMSGLELLDELKLLKNRLPVIVMSGHGDIPMAIRAIKSGAIEFVTKPFNDQFVLDLVQRNLKPSGPNENDNRKYFKSLTQREHEVMELVVEGKLNKEIAGMLNISMSTVEAHRSRIMRKMHVKNLAQLIKMCLLRQVS